MAIRKTDVDSVLQVYIRDRVNGIGPAHINGWYRPGNTGAPENSINTGYIGGMSGAPGEAVPSQNILAADVVITATTVRRAINQLTRYYAGIGRGNWGLINEWCMGWTGGYRNIVNQGSGYVNFNDAAPGVAAKRQNVINAIENRGVYPEFTNTVMNYGQLTAHADAAWALIYNSIESVQVDMVVCHSNCHNCCHGARGRR